LSVCFKNRTDRVKFACISPAIYLAYLPVTRMIEAGNYFQRSEQYRAWIDGSGTGSIRILKRVNAKTLMRILQEMLLEMKKTRQGRHHILFYISRSLNDEMSDNANEFLAFCKACLDVDFELIIVE